MKIFAVSDIIVDSLYHETVAERFPDVDILVGCGDLPYYYLEFLHSALNTSMVYVRGNHDVGPQYTADGRELTGVAGGLNLHGTSMMLRDLLLVGLEGSMRYRPKASLPYSEAEMRVQATRLFPTLLRNRLRHGRFLDILVTHSPPFQIHDQHDLAHTGFKIFRTFMRAFKPRFLLHGHVHVKNNATPRITRYGETLVINVFPYVTFEFAAPPEPMAVVEDY